MKLTQKIVDQLDQKQTVFDDDLAGFGVRIYDGGKKSYFVRGRVSGRGKKMMTIGCARQMKIHEARTRAMEILMEFRKGNDCTRPKAHEMTVRDAMDYFYDTHANSLKSASCVLKSMKVINSVIGKRLIVDLTKADILKLKTEVGKRSPAVANKAIAWLSSAINHCRGEITDLHHVVNVCQFVTKFKIQARETYVTPDEMPRLLEAIKREPNPYGRAAVILYILLGQRKDEILRIEHRNIDLNAKRLRWDDTKNGKKHYIPLSDEALEVIKNMPRVLGSPWLFPAINPPRGMHGQDHLKDIRHSWNRIREDAQLKHVTVHDLRRTLGSWMAMGGEPLSLIGKILNHSSPAVTAEHYAHFDDTTQRDALNRHAAKVLSHRGFM